MSFTCGPQYQQTYQAEVQLWSEMIQGIPSGSGLALQTSHSFENRE